MKKLLCLLLFGLSCTAVTLTGCRSKDAGQAEIDSNTAVVEPDLSYSSSLQDPDETPPAGSEEYAALDEIKYASALQPKFQMGSLPVELGNTLVADLLDAGAVLMPNDHVNDPEFLLTSGEVSEIMLNYEDAPFSLGIKNDSGTSSAVKNAVITSVYADQGNLFGIGGIKPGDDTGDLTYTLGEPYLILSAYETPGITDHDISAYYYSSRLDDRNVVFFVSEDLEQVVSFREALPIDYIVSADSVTEEMLNNLKDQFSRMKNSSEQGSPFLADLENSEYASGVLSDLHYTAAYVYLLDEITDPETFNADAETPEDLVGSNYLIVEYTATLSYPEEETARFRYLFQNKLLEPSYTVYGCFYVINPYLDDEGLLQSNMGPELLHEPEGLYLSQENMLEDVVHGSTTQGYAYSDYSVSERDL